ncbi:thioredoxin-related protein [Pedobacter sp. UYP30]|uniref:thioredoxin family protein n=1 Tax=Pedobacter sp. UYP30 TaxID=1756400 RepID=UPI00339905B7
MKLLFICLIGFFVAPPLWMGDFSQAEVEAKASHKLILINFSGSDWCGPCIRLRKEILESPEFTAYAKEKLILVRADFTRQKKNQLAKDQIKLNEALADRYNMDGKFPYTLLVDENGKVLKSWDGLPDESAAEFVKDIAENDH